MTDPAPPLLRRVARKADHVARRLQLLASIRRIHGPRRFELAADDVVVVLLMRNSAYYLEPLFSHYRNLGVSHFVCVDNGSDDDTIEIAARQPGTIILQSHLKIAEFEVEFRRHAAETYARDHWVMFVDTDELLDFEGAATLGLPGLARHLRDRGHTALMAPMLEMFAPGPINAHAATPFETALDTHRFYDLTRVMRYEYYDTENISFNWLARQNTLANPAMCFMFGGVRLKVFGEMCCLTKHPLVFVGNGVWPNPHPHCPAFVRVSDAMGVLKHYKFTNDPLRRDLETVRDGIVPHGADRLRVETVRDNPDISLFSHDAREYRDVDQLYDDGFLLRSDALSARVASARTV